MSERPGNKSIGSEPPPGSSLEIQHDTTPEYWFKYLNDINKKENPRIQYLLESIQKHIIQILSPFPRNSK
ncbi:hypothetical protein EYC84_004264 [Monilinia fructicola]|uniref:Uncharacterized protein n=1 Tax=Monilinia fructicola TaxID=38448 RepID=A0A5M9JZR4_MONFR|nr:hypothetical protein EYC84_004264 [Monilinia fructicola]